MTQYNMVAATSYATVVAEYNPLPYDAHSYQSEAQLEAELLQRLGEQGYELIQVPSEEALINNLRVQLEVLNGVAFSEGEWQRFYAECVSGANEGILEKTRRIQRDPIQVLRRDDGSIQNIRLLDRQRIHNNRLQVMHQFVPAGGTRANRYDVTILVNGLPLVHVELKRRGVALKEAFNQVARYQRESFSAGAALFDYVQIFVISNGTHTKYYSNTTRRQSQEEARQTRRSQERKTSHSFEFTNFWADAGNRNIPDLVDFTRTFFARNTLLAILTHYCVFTSQNMLLVMRPYQITATERILQRILTSGNVQMMGKKDAGGYIWHTTGSGKTLTSFKTAQLATAIEGVEKVLFVVDRKDLDYQTMAEYERFQKGAANSNVSTRVLQQQLEDPQARIIITTIQKLDHFIRANRTHPIYTRRVVIIFDECHRSQFGAMHQAITRAFRRYHLFGFTGTPIFAPNAARGSGGLLRTTEDTFGERLHSYTIVDAINDRNVLPFRIDYVNTLRMREGIEDVQVRGIDIERALMAPQRVRAVAEYVLAHFDQKTMRNRFQTLAHNRQAGFNAILATASIPLARAYYAELKNQLSAAGRELRLALIYSFNPNEDPTGDGLGEEGFETGELDQPSRDFLEAAIADYNAQFNTNYDTSAERFENYYKDLSRRVKDREVDLLIVVNMFLTGFDATTLNTLWVDKNLRQHGLLQAYSRTNRILNSVKTFGNIICFRDLKQETDDAIALFGNKEAGGVVLLKTYPEYYHGYEEDGKQHPGYQSLVAELEEKYPLGQEIRGEEAQKEFIRLYGAILRLRNILTAFDEFEGHEILTERQFQDYQSLYIDLYQEYRGGNDAEKVDITDDLVFEVELIRQVEVNIDYILELVAKYQKSNLRDGSIRATIDRAIGSSLELRSKKTLIEGFIAQINLRTDVHSDWPRYVAEQKEHDLAEIIAVENLRPEPTRRYIDGALRDRELRTTGLDFDGILPAMSRFGGLRAAKKVSVMERLRVFFEKYLGLD